MGRTKPSRLARGLVLIGVSVASAAKPSAGQGDPATPSSRGPRLGRIGGIGHSGHAYLALEYAKRYPANVTHGIMIGITPDLRAASWLAAARYWQESVSPERKAALRENLRRRPDKELAKLPPRERFVKGYVRDGPRAWFNPRFDASPLWEGVDVNVPMFD